MIVFIGCSKFLYIKTCLFDFRGVAQNFFECNSILILFFSADGFGLTLEGGADRPLFPNDDGVFITSIKMDSNADKLGCLETGDKILQVKFPFPFYYMGKN